MGVDQVGDGCWKRINASPSIFVVLQGKMCELEC
jgi:hypothetical protein